MKTGSVTVQLSKLDVAGSGFVTKLDIGILAGLPCLNRSSYCVYERRVEGAYV